MAIDHSNDIDPTETEEWLESLESVVEEEGAERAAFLLQKLQEKAGSLGIDSAYSQTFSSPYMNSISVAAEPAYPGDLEIERKIEALMRWNAAVTVAGANSKDGSLGGHISSYASSCSLYEVGFNHFWHAYSKEQPGDLIMSQGHSSPGIYARAYLEGRLTDQQLAYYRKEVDGKGISSYPHPYLMPDFWQFPTVSMGLGPLMGIYQARFMKYLHSRGLTDTAKRKVWVFCGDGEMDEPESMGALLRAGREKLDNLIFVINCNLQRLDGPVHGNGKLIQEFEGAFKGAGWNVIKVIFGSNWDPLFAKDKTGALLKAVSEICDGEFQTMHARGGAYMREHLFGRSEELKALVADMSDDEIFGLMRGGHDPKKVYAAYQAAIHHKGQPSVILAKTVKGYGMGKAGEAMNIAHNQKKMAVHELQAYRDRFKLDIPDHRLLEGTGPDRTMSTTTAYVQVLTALCKDPNVGKLVVPICPDESRTLGMEGLFRQIGIYNAEGQKYEPEDRAQVMYYKESADGQFMQEGINEAGAFGSWLAGATSYSVHHQPMIPFYAYYAMFGFQRIMDFIWLAGDMRARGFLMAAISGRTTINGEGLQHEDGHSHVMANLVPSCISYDPTYAYEMAVIIWHGSKRMYEQHHDEFYYISMMNENYHHPAMPEGCEQGIIKGLYLLKSSSKPNTKSKDKAKQKMHVQLMGSGSILLEVEAAAEMLEKDFGISSDIWSMTSSNNLYRDGMSVKRFKLLNPDQPAPKTYIEECLADKAGPIVAATDYVKLYTEQLREFMPRRYVTLGTDGYGRSDSREKLREFFEVNR
ncbi:MAG: aceE, partial [Gammaproteobacteria bacterium]|nr:aceE [Gammaproteobacteria bacterium]